METTIAFRVSSGSYVAKGKLKGEANEKLHGN